MELRALFYFRVSALEAKIAPEVAAEKVARTNSLRCDHYSYFTEKTWGDSRNYAAVFDTSRLSPNAVVQSVIALYLHD